MEILLAKSAGFCFGVKRAIDMVLGCKGGHVYTLGPLIHNKQVVRYLEQKNILQIDQPNKLVKGSKIVVRSHGVGKKEYDELDALHLTVVDATCPFVRNIHKIVDQYYHDGFKIIIFGDRNHPEVIGINGWCEYKALIFSDCPPVDQLPKNDKICVVAQTTSSEKYWINFKNFINSYCQKAVFFDTICSATEQRQREAEQIARQVEMMVIIGGKESSNTKKLAEICSNLCPQTYHIETMIELPKEAYQYKRRIGVTAGASTPEWIIKEVINKMSEEKVNVTENELSFAEQLEQTMVTLKTGDIVKGTVIGITPTEVYVNLGFKADGVIPLDELSSEPVANAEDIVKIGDEIEVFVVRVNDVEGTVGLSRRKLDQMAGWRKMEEAAESQEILDGKVVDVVNGGVIVASNGARVFVPASQASTRYLEDLNVLKNEAVSFRIIDINPKRRKLIGSIKVVASEVRKQQQEVFWANVEEGKVYQGKVKNLMDFGAFVDLGGVDGLVHISELSWSRIKHPSEVLKVGDAIDVFVKGIDIEKHKISLGYKKDEDNPWKVASEKLHLGDVVTCKIVRLVPFGAFAEILPMVDGLIHISQIANQRIAKPSSVLSVGQEVEAKIIELDLEKQKISLSMKVLLPDYVEEIAPAVAEVNDVAKETDSSETVEVTQE